MVNHFIYDANEWLIFIGLFGLELLVAEMCFRIGSRQRTRIESPVLSQIGTIQAAALGLLALLLGFAFSMSISRFDARKQLILDESNAIGTAYLRAQLLPEPYRSEVPTLLRRYVDVRLEFYAAGENVQKLNSAISETEQLHHRLWSQAVAVADRDDRAVTLGLFLTALNDMIDLHSKRVAALENRIPQGIFWLLYFVVIVGMGLTGYACGVAGQRNLFPTLAAALLISAVILLILDLHRPRQGLIQVGEQRMVELQKSLNRSDP